MFFNNNNNNNDKNVFTLGPNIEKAKEQKINAH